MKVTEVAVENVKKVRTVELDCSGESLTVIGGKNRQGKTSILDALTFALGGGKYKPSAYKNTDTVGNPSIVVKFDNGIVVERTGKNGSLKVTDQHGKKAGQSLLNEFITQFALNLPKFLNSNDKEKAKILLDVIGVEKELYEIEQRETKIYNERHGFGTIVDQKKKYALELDYYEDMPEKPIESKELLDKIQKVMAQNVENRRLKDNKEQIERNWGNQVELINSITERLQEANDKLEEIEADKEKADLVEIPEDQDTEEIQAQIDTMEDDNTMIRANLEKQKAEEDAEAGKKKYDLMTEDLEAVRAEKFKLLQNADLPLPGLSIIDGVLAYNEIKWDCLSSSEQLKIAVSIVQKLNGNCQFVLMDKLEQMDVDTMNEFGEWLTEKGLQVIATRVSTGDECSIIIEDGSPVENKKRKKAKSKPAKPEPVAEEELDDDCDF